MVTESGVLCSQNLSDFARFWTGNQAVKSKYQIHPDSLEILVSLLVKAILQTIQTTMLIS